MLVANGIGGAAEIAQAKEASQGLGLFVRSLIGLDREAAKATNRPPGIPGVSQEPLSTPS